MTLRFVIFLFFPLMLFAHDDLNFQIDRLSKRIEANPQNANLYLKRGDLFFQQEQWIKSIRDFEKSIRIENLNNETQVKIALAWYELGQLDFAMEYINRALENNHNHAHALWTKGKLLYKKGDWEKSQTLLKKAIDLNAKKLPDQFLELVDLLENNESIYSLENAITILDEGIEHLGQLMVFQEKKVELFCKMKKFDAAIQIQTEIIIASTRKERAYLKRALLYQQSKNPSLALKDAYSCQQALNKLPGKYRFLRSTQELESVVNQLINQLIQDD